MNQKLSGFILVLSGGCAHAAIASRQIETKIRQAFMLSPFLVMFIIITRSTGFECGVWIGESMDATGAHHHGPASNAICLLFPIQYPLSDSPLIVARITASTLLLLSLSSSSSTFPVTVPNS